MKFMLCTSCFNKNAVQNYASICVLARIRLRNYYFSLCGPMVLMLAQVLKEAYRRDKLILIVAQKKVFIITKPGK